MAELVNMNNIFWRGACVGITGITGSLGTALSKELLRPEYNISRLVGISRKWQDQDRLRKELGDNDRLRLFIGDIRDIDRLRLALDGVEYLVHAAAIKSVPACWYNPTEAVSINGQGTINVLQAARDAGVKRVIVISSDKAVAPASGNLYGATKAACESYIQTYASYYGWKVYIFRFVSFIGERYTHGIIFDILKKVKKNKKVLELLSDGTPKKSSVYVGDGIDAMFKVIDLSKEQINIYNIGHDDILTVDQIVDTIIEAGNIKIKKKYLGGKKGWMGDNNFVHLDNSKLKKLGWKPKLSFKQGIKKTVEYLQSEESKNSLFR